MRSRLDVEMTRRGLSESRESAQRLIMAGRVRVNSRPANKPDLKVEQETEIAIIARGLDYESRGGSKPPLRLADFDPNLHLVRLDDHDVDGSRRRSCVGPP